MSATQKVFRIESYATKIAPSANGADPHSDGRHQQIMTELGELRQMITPAQTITESVVTEYKAEMTEALKLKSELQEMYEAISKTKSEIATLHHSGFEGEQMLRVTDELDAIVTGTEQATESILHAAENIDDNASMLASQLKGNKAETVGEITEKVVSIYEACNFQDLTGQRISKVVNTLKFIEERIIRMMEIWGGVEEFHAVNVETMPTKEGDDALLNGPALQSDENIASQDDIDALFD